MAPRRKRQCRALDRELPPESLDWALVVNLRHLKTIIEQNCLQYNDERPHRSRSLWPASRVDRIQIA
jgi:hypothetical protein